jgi:hypothetical protein
MTTVDILGEETGSFVSVLLTELPQLAKGFCNDWLHSLVTLHDPEIYKFKSTEQMCHSHVIAILENSLFRDK